MFNGSMRVQWTEATGVGLQPAHGAALRLFATFAAALAALLGLTVLVGVRLDRLDWAIQISKLPPMTANSALCAVLGGLALGLRARSTSLWRAWVSRFAALMVLLLAGLTLLEYALGVGLGIDGLLVSLPEAELGTRTRPSIISALSFASLAVAFALLDARGWRLTLLREGLSLLALLLSMITAAGYVFAAASHFEMPGMLPYMGMSPQSVGAVMLLAAGGLCARTEQGLTQVLSSDLAGGYVARRLGLVVLLIPLLSLLVDLGHHLGWYSRDASFALVAVLSMLVTGVLLVSTSLTLNRVDAERRNALEQMRHWKQFFDSAEFGAAFIGLDGELLMINPALARMHGYEVKELLGKPLAKLLGASSEEQLRKLFAELDTTSQCRLELPLVRKDGSIFPATVNLSAVRDSAGRTLFRGLSIDDVSRERAAEEALRQSEARYRDLVLQASDGIFIADLEGRYTDVNEAGCRMLKMSREQIVGKTVRDLVAPEEIPLFDQSLEHLLKGHSEVADWRLRKGDGTYLPVEVSAKVLPDGRLQGFVRDITARKAAEEKLRLAHQLEVELRQAENLQRVWLESVIEQMPEGVVLLDQQGNAVAINAAAWALSLGQSEGTNVFGNPKLFDVRTADGVEIEPEDYPGALALREGKATVAREVKTRTATGRLVPILVNAGPVRDADGKIVGALVVMQDITAMKELERLREEWASLVAHDLRQPVGVISLSVDVLRRSLGTLEEREARSLERIRTASQRLNRMINDLLDVSRLEAKRLAVEARRVRLDELVREVPARMGEALGGRPVKIEGPEGLEVLADAARIEQVLGNLLSNASKYGEPGSEIEVAFSQRGTMAQVTVTNRGKGISPRDMSLLFERFQRTKGSEGAPGLGLGLYISKGLVEAHGGRIWAESTPGQTTRFHFTLPLAPPLTEHAPSAAP